MAQGLLQAGQTAIGGGINALYGSTGAGRSILESEAYRRAADRQLGAALGGGLYSLFQGTPGKGNSLMDLLNSFVTNRGPTGPGYSSPGGSRPREW